jgi:hypothetical protein
MFGALPQKINVTMCSEHTVPVCAGLLSQVNTSLLWPRKRSKGRRLLKQNAMSSVSDPVSMQWKLIVMQILSYVFVILCVCC